MDSTPCASADPSNFLVPADANHQARCSLQLMELSEPIANVFRLHTHIAFG